MTRAIWMEIILTDIKIQKLIMPNSLNSIFLIYAKTQQENIFGTDFWSIRIVRVVMHTAPIVSKLYAR